MVLPEISLRGTEISKVGEVDCRVEHKRKRWESLAVALRDWEVCKLIGGELHGCRLRLAEVCVCDARTFKDNGSWLCAEWSLNEMRLCGFGLLPNL